MSKAYQQRPSIFLGIRRSLDAYYLDRAVMHFGTALDAALEKAIAPGKGKRQMSEAQMNAKIQRVLVAWLGPDAVQKRYKDPMARFNKE